MKTPTNIAAKCKRAAGLTLLATFICHCQLFAATPAPTDAKSGHAKKSSEECTYAVWYCVPPNSLARRRAKPTELTAAHNRLPLGTLVRVTRLSNGRSVLVRITDRGITNRRAKIDICKEAADQLGMVREGLTRVQLEIVPEPPSTVVPDQNQVAAH